MMKKDWCLVWLLGVEGEEKHSRERILLKGIDGPTEATRTSQMFLKAGAMPAV